MRSRIIYILAAFVLLYTSTIKANIVGVDSQNFNPITNGIDFVTVHSSKTLEPGIFNLGLFLNYAGNSLPYYENFDTANSNPQTLTNANDTLLSADVNFGLGLIKGWDIGVNFPYLLRQAIDDCTACGKFENTGLTEWKVNTKVGLYRNEDWGLAFIGSVAFNRILNNPFTGVDPGPTINLELAADTKIEDVNLGFNIGYRLRNPGDSLYWGPDKSTFTGSGNDNLYLHTVPNQIIYSVAASYLLTSIDTKLIWEFFGATYNGDFEYQRYSDRESNETAVETLLGLKHDVTTNLALHGGIGTEVIHGIGTPDWRIYVGLNWTMGPVWSTEDKTEPLKTVEITEEVPYEKEYEEDIPEVQKVVLSNLRFKFNKTELEEYSYDDVERLKTLISSTNNIKKIIIEGHTDSIGSEDYNQKLSEGRAKAIKNIIIRDLGMDSSIFESYGYGESQPIADNGNYQGRAKNRRVEVKIYREVMKTQKRTKILKKKVKRKVLVDE